MSPFLLALLSGDILGRSAQPNYRELTSGEGANGREWQQLILLARFEQEKGKERITSQKEQETVMHCRT